MVKFDQFLKDEHTVDLMSNSKKLEQLRDAPETQKIFSLLNQSTGGGLEQAAENAAKGDSAQLISAIKKLMQDPDGAQLIQKIKQKLT